MSKLSKAIAVLGVVAGLGVAALPLSSYAESSDSGKSPKSVEATVKVAVEESISITINNTEISLGTDGKVDASAIATGNTQITVKTNAANGYNVKLAAKTESGVDNTKLHTEGASATIESVTGTGQTLTPGTSAWGYKVSGNTYDEITTSGATIKNVTGEQLKSDNGITEVTFGVAISETQEQGNYSANIVFTASANS